MILHINNHKYDLFVTGCGQAGAIYSIDNGDLISSFPLDIMGILTEIDIDLMIGNSKIDVEKRLCAHPEVLYPNEDTMLAQKIYLEHLEHEFLQVAKEYPVRH